MRSCAQQKISNEKRNSPHISISLGFCVSVAIMSLFDTSGMFSVALLAILIHETGHIVAIYLLGEEIKEISFKIFGVEIKANLPYRRKTAIIMFAGPFFNIVTALLLLPFVLQGNIFIINLCFSSLVLGLFHLLPAYGLDGGNAVMYLLNGSNKAEIAVKGFAFTVSAMLFAVGFYAVYNGIFNLSAFILALYFLINCISGRNNFFNSSCH